MPSPVATVTGTPTVHPEARRSSSVLCRHRVLRDLLAASIVLVEDWDSLSNQDRQEIEECTSTSALAEALVRHSLLTKYQADRVEAGKTFGLVLNNYRVLERLGAGAMGVVFKAENVRLRRPVALKVLALGHEGDPRLLLRFFAEIRRDRSDAASQHRRGDGRRGDPGQWSRPSRLALPGHGVRARPGSRRVRARTWAAAHAQSLRRDSSGRIRPVGGTSSWPDPPGHQAFEHPADPRGASQVARLRPGQALRPSLDRPGHAARHHRIHRARTGARRARSRYPRRPLQPRRYLVLVPHRAKPVSQPGQSSP